MYETARLQSANALIFKMTRRLKELGPGTRYVLTSGHPLLYVDGRMPYNLTNLIHKIGQFIVDGKKIDYTLDQLYRTLRPSFLGEDAFDIMRTAYESGIWNTMIEVEDWGILNSKENPR
jgi:hypothetical protein